MVEEIEQTGETKKKKKGGGWKYLVSISVVLLLTGFSLLYSFYTSGTPNADFWAQVSSGFNLILDAIKQTNIIWLVAIIVITLLSYVVDGLAIKIFCRLYTRRYSLAQGSINSLVGAYYNAVTPGASGGQVMQIYTLRSQGVEVSNGASIMVMWFIIYQLALIFLDIFALVFEWSSVMSLSAISFNGLIIPMIPLIVFGFLLNLGVILFLLLMSYSRGIHNFFMNHLVNLLAKIRVLKNPDKTRENIRVQVENFKIELKRLQSNVPATVIIFLLMLTILLIRFSIPYFCGLALNAYGVDEAFSFARLFDGIFRSAFHQMVTGIIPIPGGAGISEYVFNQMFMDYYIESQVVTPTGIEIVRSASANLNAVQIIWRFSTFHLIVLIGGLISAFYHGKRRDKIPYANRQTYLNLQMYTYEARKQSADTLYETRQLSKKRIRKRLTPFSSPKSMVGTELITGDDYLPPLEEQSRNSRRFFGRGNDENPGENAANEEKEGGTE